MGMASVAAAAALDGEVWLSRVCTGSCKKNLAKFGEVSSVWADGLYNGRLGQWAEVRRGNLTTMNFFCTNMYMLISLSHSFSLTFPLKNRLFLMNDR